MKIGPQAGRSSAISASNADSIVVRGFDLCRDLIGQVTFTDHAWLLVTGSLPTAAQRRILDATLVAIAEHGLVPSIAAGIFAMPATSVRVSAEWSRVKARITCRPFASPPIASLRCGG